jgi:hypothetical protein
MISVPVTGPSCFLRAGRVEPDVANQSLPRALVPDRGGKAVEVTCELAIGTSQASD